MKLSDVEALAATLPSEEVLFATRYTLNKSDAGAVYLQRVHCEDRDPEPRHHPWSWMTTTVLHGGLTQRWGVFDGGAYREIGVRGYRPGEGYSLGPEHAHRIVIVMPLTWTLLLVGPERGSP